MVLILLFCYQLLNMWHWRGHRLHERFPRTRGAGKRGLPRVPGQRLAVPGIDIEAELLPLLPAALQMCG